MFIQFVFKLTLPLNEPVPVAIKLVVPKLPVLALPDTFKLVNVPTDVIFAWPATVTLPA